MLAAGKPLFLPTNPLSSGHSVTYDVPGTLVRIALKKSTGYRIPAGMIPPFIHTSLVSLDHMASHAGGPTAPLEPDRRDIRYANYGLEIKLNDITVRYPEVGGGRLRYDEVKAVFEGVGAVISQIGDEECVIDAWRMVNGSSGRSGVKFLVSGYLINGQSEARLGRLGFDKAAGNETGRSRREYLT
ncbi:MAG: hypothetical protein Q9166_005193 [cf. Caloplaca sp. 2 TL-2023]